LTDYPNAKEKLTFAALLNAIAQLECSLDYIMAMSTPDLDGPEENLKDVRKATEEAIDRLESLAGYNRLFKVAEVYALESLADTLEGKCREHLYQRDDNGKMLRGSLPYVYRLLVKDVADDMFMAFKRECDKESELKKDLMQRVIQTCIKTNNWSDLD